MIMANLAAQKTKEMITHHKTTELQRIDDGIRSQINCGSYEYCYDGYISLEARAELERCGYKVETGSQYNQGYVRISWR